jgi:hypothetical protein
MHGRHGIGLTRFELRCRRSAHGPFHPALLGRARVTWQAVSTSPLRRHRVAHGLTEDLNLKIKNIKRITRGLLNFTTVDYGLLFGCG